MLASRPLASLHGSVRVRRQTAPTVLWRTSARSGHLRQTCRTSAAAAGPARGSSSTTAQAKSTAAARRTDAAAPFPPREAKASTAPDSWWNTTRSVSRRSPWRASATSRSAANAAAATSADAAADASSVSEVARTRSSLPLSDTRARAGAMPCTTAARMAGQFASTTGPASMSASTDSSFSCASPGSCVRGTGHDKRCTAGEQPAVAEACQACCALPAHP